MKRKIIEIDQKKCNGCGLCTNGCPEGALQIVNGKAHLVGELLCDGLGACISTCPQNAMTIVEREAEAYDEFKVMDNVVGHGKDVVAAHLHHLKRHGQKAYYDKALEYLKRHKMEMPAMEEKLPCGCPGTMSQDFRGKQPAQQSGPVNAGNSQLQQWPVQLKLLNPLAPYFNDADLLVCADCVPFAYPNLHERFLKGKTVVVFCPKLDAANEVYIEKLTNVFKENNVKSVTVLHMEVPCCFGTVKFVEEALKLSGKNIVMKEYTISIRGEIV